MPNSPVDHFAIFTSVESNSVTPDEACSNPVFGDLSTFGPSVTLQTGPVVIAYVCSSIYSTTGFASGDIGIDVSGATIIAPTVNFRTCETTLAGFGLSGSAIMVISGLAPGINTFTMKYRSSSTVRFFWRGLTILST